MITEEEFRDIATKAANGEGLTNAEAIGLVQTIAELDQRGTIAQSVVQFTLTAAEEIYKDAVELVVKEIQIRDKAKAQAIIKSSGRAAANLRSVVQIYIAQVYAQMQQQSAVADADPDVLDDSTTA